MSRDLADENYYVSQGKDKIPVKWTAPEAIHYKKYSTASDVWAYGCLLYEIWSIGHKPFEANKNVEVNTCTYMVSNHMTVRLLLLNTNDMWSWCNSYCACLALNMAQWLLLGLLIVFIIIGYKTDWTRSKVGSTPWNFQSSVRADGSMLVSTNQTQKLQQYLWKLSLFCRHPENSQRPAFRDVVLSLARGEEMILNIPEEDSSTNPLAGVLGAPLEAGENMYSQLQSRYQ